MPSSTTATSGLRAQFQQRERQADVIVQVAPVPKHRVLRRQELRGELLRRRLARAAGDRHHRRARAAAHFARAVLERPRRVGHLDQKRRRPGLSCLGQSRRRRHHRSGRARGQRSGDEVVPVEPIAANRDEQIAGLRSTACRSTTVRRAGPDRPSTTRPPVAAAISAALSEIDIRHRSRSPASRCAAAPARRAPLRRRRTAASCRRSPGTSRAPCRRSGSGRRARASRTAFSIASRRSTIASDGVPFCCPFGAIRSAGMTMPRRISSRIFSGSSLRGLSDVTITRSLSRAATAPISGRFVRSRSPPQPNTVTSRPVASGRAVSSRFFSASSVCA